MAPGLGPTGGEATHNEIPLSRQGLVKWLGISNGLSLGHLPSLGQELRDSADWTGAVQGSILSQSKSPPPQVPLPASAMASGSHACQEHSSSPRQPLLVLCLGSL